MCYYIGYYKFFKKNIKFFQILPIFNIKSFLNTIILPLNKYILKNILTKYIYNILKFFDVLPYWIL